MINLGLIDILLLVLVISVYFYTRRRHEMFPFYAVVVVVAIIELERLVPGTLKTLGDGIRTIDVVNESLPHVSISPIITIK